MSPTCQRIEKNPRRCRTKQQFISANKFDKLPTCQNLSSLSKSAAALGNSREKNIEKFEPPKILIWHVKMCLYGNSYMACKGTITCHIKTDIFGLQKWHFHREKLRVFSKFFSLFLFFLSHHQQSYIFLCFLEYYLINSVRHLQNMSLFYVII